MIRFSGSDSSTALKYFIFNVSQTFLGCDKILAGPGKKKVCIYIPDFSTLWNDTVLPTICGQEEIE